MSIVKKKRYRERTITGFNIAAWFKKQISGSCSGRERVDTCWWVGSSRVIWQLKWWGIKKVDLSCTGEFNMADVIRTESVSWHDPHDSITNAMSFDFFSPDWPSQRSVPCSLRISPWTLTPVLSSSGAVSDFHHVSLYKHLLTLHINCFSCLKVLWLALWH